LNLSLPPERAVPEAEGRVVCFLFLRVSAYNLIIIFSIAKYLSRTSFAERDEIEMVVEEEDEDDDVFMKTEENAITEW
jgi:hypothetical protein